MKWELSEFGHHLCRGSGIGELMDDLGAALAQGGDHVRMLGGGQPAHIPAIDAIWHDAIGRLAADDLAIQRVLGKYEPPAGNLNFRRALAALLRDQFGWDVSEHHVAITAGGQTAFFFLFNALAGEFPDGRRKKILLPLVPEYMGYANQSVGGEMFQSFQPQIERLGDHAFKYHVDFDRLQVTDEIAAICVSRPTNPSGNVLTDTEIGRLGELASEHHIPLIIDNAYGAPFPGAIFVPATPVWNPNVILTLSLSKLGLPGTRTGIVVADPEVIRAVASLTSIVGLANSNIGQAMVTPLLESGDILRISDQIVRPFYQAKSDQAVHWAHECFDPSLPYRIHRSEGAFFVWMWFEGLPISSQELYQRLKRRDVLVVPGNHFFFGLDHDAWPHRHECIRVTFTMPEQVVRSGLQVIAEEVQRAYRESHPAATSPELIRK